VEVKVNDDYSYYLVIKSIDKTGSEDEEIRGF
jgi:transcription elongation factor